MADDTAQMLRRSTDDEATRRTAIDRPVRTATGSIADARSADFDRVRTNLRRANVDYDLGGEPATMSEVGTKLDLARAYMDMGDPEGARSILDEVLQEGSTTQRQEAERLIASLP